jgi:hypothetical protein
MIQILAGHPVPYSLTVQGARSRRAARQAADDYLARTIPGAIVVDSESDYYRTLFCWYLTPDIVQRLRNEGKVDSLLPIDVGFDVRLQRMEVELRPETELVQYETRSGEIRWAGSRSLHDREPMLAQLRCAGYRVAETGPST